MKTQPDPAPVSQAGWVLGSFQTVCCISREDRQQMGSRCVLQHKAFLLEGISPDLSPDFAVGVSLIMYSCLASLQLPVISIDFPGVKAWSKFCLLLSIATVCCLSIPSPREGSTLSCPEHPTSESQPHPGLHPKLRGQQA